MAMLVLGRVHIWEKYYTVIPKPELRGLWEDSFTITTIRGDQPAGIGRCNLLRHMGFLVNSPWIIHQSYWFHKSSSTKTWQIPPLKFNMDSLT